MRNAALRIRRAGIVVGVIMTVAALAACTSGGGGEEDDNKAKPITLIFSNHTPAGGADNLQIEAWMDRVTELTDGQVEFELNYSASLLSAADAFAGVKDGRVDMAYHAAFYNPAEFPLSQAAGIPFLTDNAEAHTAALGELFEENESFRDEYLRNGVRPIFFVALGSSALGSATPIESIDDMAGLSIRSGGLLVQAVEAAGASPVALAYEELYLALERGVLQGYTAAQMTSAFNSGLFEVNQYMANAGIGNYVASSLLMNEDTFQGLPENVRAAMEEAAVEMRVEAGAIFQREAVALCEPIAEAGGVVTTWSEDAVKEWKDLTGDGPANSWLETVTGAGVPEDVAKGFLSDFEDRIKGISSSSAYVDPMTVCAEQAG